MIVLLAFFFDSTYSRQIAEQAVLQLHADPPLQPQITSTREEII